MKKILLYLILLFLFSGMYSQGIFNNGGKIVIGTGAYLNVTGTSGGFRNETNTTDGEVILNGNLKVEGDYINNVANFDIINPGSTGNVILAGAIQQLLAANSTAAFGFINLEINNASGISLLHDATVSGTLTLSSGLLDIGSSNLTLGPLSTVSGSPSSANMVVATGNGEVRKEYSTTEVFTFPVGDNTATAEYSPVSVDITAGTFAPGAYVGLNLVNDKYNDPAITDSYLNRYWNLSQTGITGMSANALFQYGSADVTGTESNIYTLLVSPAPITSFRRCKYRASSVNSQWIDLFWNFYWWFRSKDAKS